MQEEHAMDLKDLFDTHEDEFNEFDRIEEPLHRRRDICALMLLDRLVPGETGNSIINDSDGEFIMLDVDCKELAEVISEEDVITLLRCGVKYDEDYECLVYVA
jgi:hypothetical protein